MMKTEDAAGKGVALLPGGVPIEDIHSANARKGYALWNRLRGSRRFPSRADVVPRDLRDLLRYTGLVRVLDKGNDFEVRLVGDAIVQAQGISFSGHTAATMAKLAPGYAAELRRVFSEIYRTGCPAAFRGWYERDPGPKPVYHETVFLPLGPHDGEVDYILVIAAYAASRDEPLR